MRILLVADDQFVAQIDSARGDVSRSAWIRRACENRLEGEDNGKVASDQRSAPVLSRRTVGGSVDHGRACAHPETTFKMGARYCVKCGEFV